MISFAQFLKEEKGKSSYKIYCDMDGVLVDFIGGIIKELKLRREPYQDEIDYFLTTTYGSSVRFWSRLPWMPDGKKLWTLLKQLNTEILSACPSNCEMQPSVKKGKIKWCKQNLKISTGINITTRQNKVRFVGKNNILIDDYIKNINEWKRAGGKAIHHRSARQTAQELKDIILGK